MPEENTSVNSPAGISYRDEVRRKLVHLSSLWMPCVFAAAAFFPDNGSRMQIVLFAVFAVMTLLSLLAEHAYANGNRTVIRIYDIFFGNMLRRKPEPGQWIISGGPYVLGAAALSILLFPPAYAACAMAVMLLGDTAAALAGRRFGRHKTVNGKSMEGFAAFIAAGYSGCVIFLLICPLAADWKWIYLWAFAGVFAASLAELFEKQLHIDDNFSIPVVAGAFLYIPALVFTDAPLPGLIYSVLTGL